MQDNQRLTVLDPAAVPFVSQHGSAWQNDGRSTITKRTHRQTHAHTDSQRHRRNHTWSRAESLTN